MVKRAHRAIIIFLSRLEEKKMQAKKEELAYKGKKLSLNELWIIIVLCVSGVTYKNMHFLFWWDLGVSLFTEKMEMVKKVGMMRSL